MTNIKIIVATHKNYWMPEDNMYIPVYVGAEVVIVGYVSTWEYMIRMNWQNILRSLTIHIMHWQKEQITIINIDYTIVSIIEYCAKN